MIIKNMPDEEQIRNGTIISDYIDDYSDWKDFDGKKSTKPITSNNKFEELAKLYDKGIIDSVTAIYLAMQKD